MVVKVFVTLRAMETKLIIFDFDGTLADTVDLIVETNQESQRRMGHPVCNREQIVATIGLPLREGILTMCPDVRPEDMPEWVRVYREVFERLRHEIVPALFPHVKETLANLHSQGYTLTVASSRGRESLTDFLHEMGIGQYISYVLGAEDAAKAKPNPEPVLKTLRELSFKPEEALVVGDMPVDILMGLGAGAATCGVSYGNSTPAALKAAGANYVIDDFAQLPAIIS